MSTRCRVPRRATARPAGAILTRHYYRAGFVVSERNGVWGQAIEVPGLATLNKGGYSRVFSVSCASAGNCAAGGHFGSSGYGLGFVVNERNGVWGRAAAVPGLWALNKGGWYARVDSVSCGSAGNCAAGGVYQHDGHGYGQGFVAVERNGRWGKAIEVPGLGALNKGHYAEVNSVSCGSAGNCAAGGYYHRFGRLQGFVAVERHGRWHTAIEVPGLGALNTGGGAAVASVSCPPAGSCAAGGYYTRRHHRQQGFVVSQTG